MLQGNIQLAYPPLALSSQRPFQLQQKLLEGKPLDQLPALIGLIYGLCQHAQQSASSLLAQVANQQGIRVNEPLLRLEMIKEHLIALVQQSFPCLSLTQPVEALSGIGLWVSEAKKIDHENDWCGTNADRLKDQVNTQLSLLLGDNWLLWADVSSFAEAHDLLCAIDDSGSPLLARMKTLKTDFVLPALDIPTAKQVYQVDVVDWMFQQVASQHKVAMIAQPDYQGSPLENSSFGRLGWGVDASETAHPVWGRLLAKLVDLAKTARGFIDVNYKPSSHALPLYGVSVRDHQAVSWVETARGRLFHYVRWNDALIALDYAIIAPTEWNFHPNGVVARWLSAWHDQGNEAVFQHHAMALMQFIDPCVPIVLVDKNQQEIK